MTSLSQIFHTNFSKNIPDFLLINIIVKIFVFFYWCFTYWSKKWLNISCQLFKIFLKILPYQLYFIVKIFIYLIQNLVFTNWKISRMCFLNFIEFLLFLWNFLKFFPQFIQNSSSILEYFLKIFTLKICSTIAWKCYEYTKNVLRISYKFFRNLRTVHKISSKRL